MTKRSESQFAKYLHEHHHGIYSFIHSMVRDLNDADDLYQQSTMIAWNKFDQFDHKKSFFSWFCGIARLESLNFLRTRGRNKLYFSDELNAMLIDVYENTTNDLWEKRREVLNECICKLREKDHALLRECYSEAFDIERAASTRNRSTHSIYNSLRRIRQSLLECVERNINESVRTKTT